VTRGVREAQLNPRGQILNAALALGKVLQDFQAVRMAKRTGHFRKALENRVFRSAT